MILNCNLMYDSSLHACFSLFMAGNRFESFGIRTTEVVIP